METPKFYKFGKIYQFKNVLHSLNHYEVTEPIEYVGYVKLHGTNAAVVLRPGGVYAQSRSRVITPENDNYGFARWVEEGGASEVAQDVSWGGHTLVIVYGEWIGPGIQNGVAICHLPSRRFVPFAIFYPEENRWAQPDDVIDRSTITRVGQVVVNPGDPESLRGVQMALHTHTLEVEARCPYAAAYGVEGVGEGIVWRPADSSLTFEGMTHQDLWFKTKGEKHTKSNVSSTKAPSLSAEELATIEEFLDFACSQARLEQGLTEMSSMGHQLTMQNVSHYIKWVQADVRAECSLEMEKLDSPEKVISKNVAPRAVKFYKKRIGEL